SPRREIAPIRVIQNVRRFHTKTDVEPFRFDALEQPAMQNLHARPVDDSPATRSKYPRCRRKGERSDVIPKADRTLVFRQIGIGDTVGPAQDVRRSSTGGIGRPVNIGGLPEWRLMLPVLYGRRRAEFPAAEHVAPHAAQTAAEPLAGANRQFVNEKADPAAAAPGLCGAAAPRTRIT